MTYEITQPLPGDIEQIYRIIKTYSEEGVILERTREEIAGSLENFLIARNGDEVMGAVTFYDYGPHLKEIRSLSVSKKFLRMGIGARLLDAMMKKLRGDRDMKIFVLTYTPEFFRKSGFVQVDRESLPEKIWKDCSTCRDKDHCSEIALVFNRKQGSSE